MSRSWIRLWVDILDDPKIHQMSARTYQIFTYILLIVGEKKYSFCNKKTMICRFRVVESVLDRAISQLEELGIISFKNNTLEILNWDKRQFKSDNSTLRVKRFRNVSETFQETRREKEETKKESTKERKREEKEKKKENLLCDSGESHEIALQVLEFLNQYTGHQYRPVAVNLDLIKTRLKSGATLVECRQIICRKTDEWRKNAVMNKYLRPLTLFNRSKFEQYLGELRGIEHKLETGELK
jgi:uncharacterized phage protein (TIGR02220 family)